MTEISGLKDHAMLYTSAVALPSVIKDLLAWRKRNSLSQRGAVQVMNERGFELTRGVLQGWEQGHRKPSRFAQQALTAFLVKHPRIENPPKFKPGPK
jgi:DNA-binding transcriptional regulator YiaG